MSLTEVITTLTAIRDASPNLGSAHVQVFDLIANEEYPVTKIESDDSGVSLIF